MPTVEQTTADRPPKSLNCSPTRALELFYHRQQKCGTTALAEYLSEHPRIFDVELKEPMFWSSI